MIPSVASLSPGAASSLEPKVKVEEPQGPSSPHHQIQLCRTAFCLSSLPTCRAMEDKRRNEDGIGNDEVPEQLHRGAA